MLGNSYRFATVNNTGQTLAIGAVAVKARRWNWGNPATGVRTWETTAASVYSNSATIATGTGDKSAAVANGTSAFVGGTFSISVIAPASSSGTVSLYLQNSPDGTTFDDSTTNFGTLLAVFNFTGTGTQVQNVEI